MSCEVPSNVGDVIILGDWGVQFTFTFYSEECVDGQYEQSIIDISSATSLSVRFKRPDGTTVDVTASFVTDGIDGKLTYISLDGDIDSVGWWQKQATIVLPSGKITGPVSVFRVLPAL